MASEPTLHPSRLPSDTHEVIAVLESIHVPWEEPVDLGSAAVGGGKKTYEALVYRNTVAHAGDDVVARIRDASVVVCSTCRLTGEMLERAPYLKLIMGHAVGTDHIDLEYCRRNGIQVMNSTNCNSETVAEHAISLYFATRRSLVTLHNVITDFTPSRPNEWKAKGSLNARMRDASGAPPRTCREEVAGIIGYGAVGKHIARLCTALGMKVLISERKDDDTSSSSSSSSPDHHHHHPEQQRHPFRAVLRAATVLFLAVPLSPSTRNLLSAPELALLAAAAAPVVINVSRGGVADEAAVLASLASRRLFGYGTDVFAVEPAGDADDSVLLGAAAAEGNERGGRERLNLVLTAHLAWLSGTTIANQVQRVRENLRAWGEGEGKGDVVVLGTKG